MANKPTVRILQIVLLAGLVFFSHSTNAQVTQRPNVLLIYTDDHRFSGVHCLSQQPVQTPTIDALASDGIAFKNTYLMGSFSGATCIPSRAMLHTGRQLFKLEKQGHSIPASHTFKRRKNGKDE